MYYLWVTLLIAVLLFGLAAGFAFGCRMPGGRRQDE